MMYIFIEDIAVVNGYWKHNFLVPTIMNTLVAVLVSMENMPLSGTLNTIMAKLAILALPTFIVRLVEFGPWSPTSLVHSTKAILVIPLQ